MPFDAPNRETTAKPLSKTPHRPEARALRILAKSVVRELRAQGCSRSEMVAFTNEVLELVTEELRSDDAS